MALLVLLGSGSFLTLTLKEKQTTRVPLQEIKPSMSTPSVSTATLKGALEKPPTKKEAVGEKGAAPEPAARNVKFNLPSRSAKKVYIVGDFTDWMRKPLAKGKNNLWSVTMKLKPGSYKYQFIVDDKKMADPNNKNSKDGKSVLNVKPINP